MKEIPPFSNSEIDFKAHEQEEVSKVYKDAGINGETLTSIYGFNVNIASLGDQDFPVIDVQHAQLENVLHNIGLIMTGSESLQSIALRGAGLTVDLLNEIAFDAYPTISTRVASLTNERFEIDNLLRSNPDRGVAYQYKRQWFEDNRGEIEVLTTVLMVLFTRPLEERNISMPL